MKATSRSLHAEHTESHFTLIVLLFLTATMLIMITFFMTESRKTQAQIDQINHILAAQSQAQK